MPGQRVEKDIMEIAIITIGVCLVASFVFTCCPAR